MSGYSGNIGYIQGIGGGQGGGGGSGATSISVTSPDGSVTQVGSSTYDPVAQSLGVILQSSSPSLIQLLIDCTSGVQTVNLTSISNFITGTIKQIVQITKKDATSNNVIINVTGVGVTMNNGTTTTSFTTNNQNVTNIFEPDSATSWRRL